MIQTGNLEYHHYQAFGLNIASMLSCPEPLSAAEDAPVDVRIRFGSVLEARGNRSKGGWFEAAPNRLSLNIPDVGRYLIADGRSIVIDPLKKADETALRLFLLGSAFSGLLQQRGCLPLHGSAVEIDGGCAVFLGKTGSGKSTIAALLHQRGYRVLADDVSAVSIGADQVPMVTPAYPQLKIDDRVAERLGENPSTMTRVDPVMGKVGLPLDAGFCPSPRPLSKVYEIRASDAERPGLIRLNGIQKGQVLLGNTHRLLFVEGLGQKISHFEQCMAVGGHCEVKRALRPAKGVSVAHFVGMLEKDMIEAPRRQEHEGVNKDKTGNEKRDKDRA